ncbi:hypothetical protein [Frigoribacterium sp. PhB24]|uniref:hypothetical protein n=1 Tax=Frigoribacterium sp. PhB24 TaxID=2485204 RepID=UPI000F49DFEB|nr:hypothetical protein [Frigoribacterium sp. PhB24]ROS52552.1 hypothetical protein EDF50_1016 [Frigoribacterium sp. PhB24]
MKKSYSLLGALAVAGALIVTGGTTASAAEFNAPDAVIDRALVSVGQSADDSAQPLAGTQEVDGAGLARTSLGAVTITPADAESSAVKLRDDGVQVLTVLDQGETAADFAVDVPDGAVLRDEGDRVTVAVESEGLVLTLAEFEQPWAVDARGESLPTSYSIEGNTITQTVDTTDATFPVVADPKLIPRLSGYNGAGLYVSMSGAEMKAIAAAVIAVGGVGAIAGCTLSKLTGVAGKALALICGAVGLRTAKSILRTIVNLNRSGVTSSACYEAKVLPQGPFKKVAAARC